MELPLTPLDLLARARRLFPERVGVWEGEVSWTYRAFAERCDRLAHALVDELGVRPGDRVAWLCGNTHELLEAYYGVLRLVERHGVTRLFLVPTMASQLLASPLLGHVDLSTLEQISIGGAPTRPSMLAEVEDRFGCECICGYGMTESSPTLTRSLDKPGDPPSLDRRVTTGLPILGVDARVLDEDDVEVPWDGATQGEVCARSNHVMAGYWGRPEETAEALRGGWLRTGDIAVVSPDGYLTIVDRKKDVIVSGGENISSVQVEHALAAHPAVFEVAVVGVPDDRWGEVPRAYVALRPSVDAPTEAELIEWVRSQLARYKAPKSVVFVDELPKGGTGKILKHQLRSLRAGGRSG